MAEITAGTAEKIMGAVTDYFGNEYDIDFVINVGSWDLVVVPAGALPMRLFP